MPQQATPLGGSGSFNCQAPLPVASASRSEPLAPTRAVGAAGGAARAIAAAPHPRAPPPWAPRPPASWTRANAPTSEVSLPGGPLGHARLEGAPGAGLRAQREGPQVPTQSGCSQAARSGWRGAGDASGSAAGWWGESGAGCRVGHDLPPSAAPASGCALPNFPPSRPETPRPRVPGAGLRCELRGGYPSFLGFPWGFPASGRISRWSYWPALVTRSVGHSFT